MYCPKCGMKLPEGANFCPHCDARVGDTSPFQGTPVNSQSRMPVQSSFQNQPAPQQKGHGIVFWVLAVIGGIFVFAIVAAFLFGMASGIAGSASAGHDTSSAAGVQTVQSANVAPVALDFQGGPGWVPYSNTADHFTISKPSDWTVQALSKSEIPNPSNSDMSIIMDEFVYIFPPSMKGFIMIYGADESGTLYSIFNDPGKTQISDTLYNQFIDGLYTGFTESSSVKLSGVTRDGNYYSINGYPARKVTLNTLLNGQPFNGDFYVIAHDNRYYMEGFFAMEGSSLSDASTASNIMRTFVIN